MHRTTFRTPSGAAALTVLALALCAPLAGAQLTVPNEDFPTLQEAIDQASSGDTLLIVGGTYDEALTLPVPITLAAADTNQVIIGPPAEQTDARALTIALTDTTTVILRDLTLRGSQTDTLPAMRPALGGVLLVDGNAHVTLETCTIDGGAADQGGGIGTAGAARLTLVDATITGAKAAGDGGGLATTGLSTATVTGGSITDCEAGGDGGGIAVGAGTALALERSVVAGNSATSGGGVAVRGLATLDFATIDSNAATLTAGGVFADAGASLDLQNSNVTGNELEGIACTGAAVTLAYNNRWQNGILDLATCPLGTGSIIADPRYQGGFPFDYHLTERSPGIDAADPAAAVPPGGGFRADIGAFEFQTGPTITSVTLEDARAIYAGGDTITLLVEGTAGDGIEVTVTADFSSIDAIPGEVTTTQVTPGGANTFAWRLAYTIEDVTGAQVDDVVIPITASTTLGGSTTSSITVDIDRQAPGTAPTVDPLPPGVSDARLLVSGVAADADSVAINVNQSLQQGQRLESDGRFSVTVTIRDGRNRIEVFSYDEVGNRSPGSPVQEVLLTEQLFVEVPKPFAPGDTFLIGYPGGARVEITLVNLAGQVVDVLRATGNQLIEIEWNGANAEGSTVNGGPYIACLAITDTATGAVTRLNRALLLVKNGD